MILFLIIFFGVSLQAPKSRHTILQINDGEVMAPGTLADLETFNYDILVRVHWCRYSCWCVENSKYFTLNFADREKTLKWLARYGLIANELLCPECQQQNAALVKYSGSPDVFTVIIYVYSFY